jgi:acyl-CoA reductase-like NAD-dependent aldehyde dehydrogenase
MQCTSLKQGPELAPDVRLGALVSQAQLERVHGSIDMGKAEGARVQVRWGTQYRGGLTQRSP